MTEEIILEWERKARDTHGCFTIAIPKQVANKWKIGTGSLLNIALLNDGTLKIGLSEEEIRYQKRIKEAGQ